MSKIKAKGLICQTARPPDAKLNDALFYQIFIRTPVQFLFQFVNGFLATYPLERVVDGFRQQILNYHGRHCGPDKALDMFPMYSIFQLGRDNSVGIATGYGLDGPGIESRCERDFPHPSRPALGPTHPPTQ